MIVRRLAIYLRCLQERSQDDDDFISSVQLSQLAGVTAAQVRKDLANFGQLGKQGVGYEVIRLRSKLASLLKADQVVSVAVIGVGELGTALTRYLRRYPYMELAHSFEVVALFDLDPQKQGREVEGLLIEDPESMAKVVQERHVRIGVITVPRIAAQAAAEAALRAGITAFLNFAPVRLELPPDTRVLNTDVLLELHQLAFSL